MLGRTITPPVDDGMRMEESPICGGGIEVNGESAKTQSLPQLRMPGTSNPGFSFGTTNAGSGWSCWTTTTAYVGASMMIPTFPISAQFSRCYLSSASPPLSPYTKTPGHATQIPFLTIMCNGVPEMQKKLFFLRVPV